MNKLMKMGFLSLTLFFLIIQLKKALLHSRAYYAGFHFLVKVEKLKLRSTKLGNIF